MKNLPDRMMSMTILFSILMLIPANGQDATSVNQQLLDMKLELLNSQIELFNSQLKVWETKPEALEQRLFDVDQKIQQLDFDPAYFNLKLQEIESLIEDYSAPPEEKKRRGVFSTDPEMVTLQTYKTAIAINPVRLFEGTFLISYERALTSKMGMDISGLATYATEEGFSGFYMKNQSLEYYNADLSSSIPYHNKNISGYGIEVKLKNYLLTDIKHRQKAPIGLYAAPGMMFRRLWLSGMTEYYLEDEWIEKEVTRLLNIVSMGATVGWKFSLIKVLYMDLYAGGLIRLAKYDDEEGYTKYKSLGNIDFSGVMPTMGLSIGILK